MFLGILISLCQHDECTKRCTLDNILYDASLPEIQVLYVEHLIQSQHADLFTYGDTSVTGNVRSDDQCPSLRRCAPHFTAVSLIAPPCPSFHRRATHCTAVPLIAPPCHSLHRRATHCTAVPLIAPPCHSFHRRAPHCTAVPLIAPPCHSFHRRVTHCTAVSL